MMETDRLHQLNVDTVNTTENASTTSVVSILFMHTSDTDIYRVFQKELCNDIPNVTVWRV
jgi:hypothetical protein